MKDFKMRNYLLAGVVFLGISSSAMAGAIGNLSVANCAGGGVTVTLTTIVWTPPTMGGTAGCIDTGIGTSVSYTGGGGGTLLPGVVGNILNLTAGGGSVNDFMTFAVPTAYTLDFVLTGLGPGVGNTNCGTLNAAGQTCSVAAGSPFILTYLTATTTGVSLGAFGTITDGGVTSSWIGSFTTQLNSYTGAIQTTELGGGSIASTQSGNFTVSSVPEPGTVSMFLLSGIALIGFGRKRLGKS
jgi:hypothetical protein